MAGFRERIQALEAPLFDSAIISHGFTPYLRDYDIVIEWPAAMRDGSNTYYIDARYRYRFAHCVEARVVTALPVDQTGWTWGEEFVDYGTWLRAGEPEGYVWGVCWAGAYPGMSYVADSERAANWTNRMGREMHEVLIESNVQNIELVCHDLTVHRLAKGDPMTGELTMLDSPEIIEPER